MIRLITAVVILWNASCFGSTLHPNLKAKADENVLQGHLNRIVSDSVYRNYLNIEELDRVAAYIKTQMEQYDFQCRYQEFTFESNTYRNVVCTLDLDFEENVIVGAHYDVCGDQSGADDNGSGVAGLLELARLLSQEKTRLQYNIELVGYTLEEPPFFGSELMGSYVHAKSVHEEGRPVLGMIALEMIGFFSDEEIQQYPPVIGWFFPDKADFIASISNWGSRWMNKVFKNTMQETSDLPVEILTAPSFITGVDFSDHRNYWHFGYDAIMITDTAFFRNSNYHQSTDTIDTLDFEKMAKVVDGVAEMLLSGALKQR